MIKSYWKLTIYADIWIDILSNYYNNQLLVLNIEWGDTLQMQLFYTNAWWWITQLAMQFNLS